MKSQIRKVRDRVACPVCETYAGRVRKEDEANRNKPVYISIACDSCGYAFLSARAEVREDFGSASISIELIEHADLPGLPRSVARLESYRDLRCRVLDEFRRVWRHREGRVIVEILTRKTRENPGSAAAHQVRMNYHRWLQLNRKDFPVLAKVGAANAETILEDQDVQRGRKGKTRGHGDDNQPGGAGVCR